MMGFTWFALGFISIVLGYFLLEYKKKYNWNSFVIILRPKKLPKNFRPLFQSMFNQHVCNFPLLLAQSNVQSV